MFSNSTPFGSRLPSSGGNGNGITSPQGFGGGQPFRGELENARMENMRLNRLLQECEQEMLQMNNQRLREFEDMKLRHEMEMRDMTEEKDRLVEQIEAARRSNADESKELRMEIRERQEEIDRLQTEMQELVDENALLRMKVDDGTTAGGDSERGPTSQHGRIEASSNWPYSREEYDEKLEELEAALQEANVEVSDLREKKETLEDVLEEKNVQIVALTKFEREYVSVRGVDAQIREHLAERDERLSDLELQNTMLRGKLASLEAEGQNGGAISELRMLLKEREMEVEALDTHGAVRALQVELQARDDELMRLQRKAVDDFARGFSAPDALKKIDELERSLNHKEKDLAASRVELSKFLSEAEDVVQENRYLRQVAKIPLDRLLDLTDMKIAERLSSSGAIAQLIVLEQRELEWDHERVKLRRKILELSQMVAEKGVMCHGLDADKLIFLQEFAKSLREGSVLPPRDESQPSHSDRGRDKEEISKLKSEIQRLRLRMARAPSPRDGVPPVVTSAEDSGKWRTSAVESISAAVEAKLEAFLRQHRGRPNATALYRNLGDSLPSASRSQDGPSTGRSVSTRGKQASAASSPDRDGVNTKVDDEEEQQPRRTVGEVEAGDELLLPPTAFPAIRGLPPIAYSHVLQRATLPSTSVLRGRQAPGVEALLYTMLLEVLEDNRHLRNVNEKFSEEIAAMQKTQQSRVAALVTTREEHARLIGSYSEYKERSCRAQRDKDNEIESLRREVSRLKEICAVSDKDMAGDGESIKAKYLALLQRLTRSEAREITLSRALQTSRTEAATLREMVDSIEPECTTRELFLKGRIAQLEKFQLRAHHAITVATEKLSRCVPTHEYAAMKSELVAVKASHQDLEEEVGKLRSRIQQSETVAEKARERIRDLLKRFPAEPGSSGDVANDGRDSVCGAAERELAILRKQVESDADIIEELKSQVRYLESCFSTTEASLSTERTSRYRLEATVEVCTSGAMSVINLADVERRVMAAEEILVKAEAKSLELEQAREVLAVARRQASEAKAASLRHITELKTLRETLNAISDSSRSGDEQVSLIMQLQQRLMTWIWESDKEYRVLALNQEVNRLRNEVLRLRGDNEAKMGSLYDKISQLEAPDRLAQVAEHSSVHDREDESMQAARQSKEIETLLEKIDLLEADNRSLKKSSATLQRPISGNGGDHCDVEINDLRVGAWKIIDLLQKEIIDYEARVAQLRIDNDDLHERLKRRSSRPILILQGLESKLRSSVLELLGVNQDEKKRPQDVLLKDSATSPATSYLVLEQNNKEIIQRLQDDTRTIQQRLDASETERKRLEQSLDRESRNREDRSPAEKQIRMLKRQVSSKSAEITRMRGVLDELKKETIRLAKRREEQARPTRQAPQGLFVRSVRCSQPQGKEESNHDFTPS
ncbi:hypothetical protein FOZ60_010840 [Perkinsus olseni]|uniref:Uncharacterized protein n=1 Tax=Perkinsus olseni TaxID=32597 RepID=A0A7J6PD62_PEROL|nr:hypothetical protein FOZ60_010840 [Perkinsus olseni]